MMAVPYRYNLRSLFYRKAATIFTILAVALTVAVLVLLMAVQRGFSHALSATGRTDTLICLRESATSEGESNLTREDFAKVRAMPGIAKQPDGTVLCAGELYAGISLPRVDGGDTNVAVRGASSESFQIRDQIRIPEGRAFKPGSHEIVVGRSLRGRIRGCELDGVVQIGKHEWRVVGIMEAGTSAFDSEIWGDVEILLQVFNRPSFTSVVLRLEDPAAMGSPPVKSGSEIDAPVLTPATGFIAQVLERVGGIKCQSERDYFISQSTGLGMVLVGMTGMLTFLMGIGALAGCTNTLLASVAGRTREIGGLLAVGFRPRQVFAGFVVESLAIAGIGGLLGTLIALPLDGLRAGTTNWQTFTEQAFTLRVDADVFIAAIVLTALIGSIGGLLPAWRASRLHPVEALRRT